MLDNSYDNGIYCLHYNHTGSTHFNLFDDNKAQGNYLQTFIKDASNIVSSIPILLDDDNHFNFIWMSHLGIQLEKLPHPNGMYGFSVYNGDEMFDVINYTDGVLGPFAGDQYFVLKGADSTDPTAKAGWLHIDHLITPPESGKYWIYAFAKDDLDKTEPSAQPYFDLQPTTGVNYKDICVVLKDPIKDRHIVEKIGDITSLDLDEPYCLKVTETSSVRHLEFVKQ